MLLRLNAPTYSHLDTLREERASAAVQVAGVVGFALLTILGAQVRIFLWEVPFSLQTLAVFGSGLFLGSRNGALAQLLYLTIGMFAPVFAGDGYGAAYILGAASGGYLLGYPLAAALIGYLSRRWNSLSGSTLSMVLGSMVFFTTGVVWLHFVAGHETWFESIEKGYLRFIPVDLAKILLVSMLYSGARRLTERDA